MKPKSRDWMKELSFKIYDPYEEDFFGKGMAESVKEKAESLNKSINELIASSAPRKHTTMSGFRGGLSTLADPSEIVTITPKKSALAEAIKKARRGTVTIGHEPNFSSILRTSTYPTVTVEPKSEKDKEKAKLMTEMIEWYTKNGVRFSGTTLGKSDWWTEYMGDEIMDECTIPGCTVNAKKHKDYGDYICEKHYGVYKENKAK